MWGGYSLVRKRTFTSGSTSLARRLCQAPNPLSGRSPQRTLLDLLCPDEEHRHINRVSDLVHGRAVKNIADETMPVRRHGDKIDISFAGEFNNFVRWFAQRENCIAGEAFICELACSRPQILAVLFHFLALGQFELLKIARHPAVGDVNQKQLCSSHARERFDVCEDGLISASVLQRNQDVPIHFSHCVGAEMWKKP